ncbi:hypothetical protein ABEB36_001263 [Hypothenemus hampei]|uniref:Uncharacterized protein n=1 Tax=Hypothenemus hampei TaxID=57062 RepID=A0ABD1FE29_HYPHA
MIRNITCAVFSSILFLFALRKYRERKWAKCLNKISLSGKYVVVTGANSGIGYEIAKELVTRGALVVLACRSISKAEETRDKIWKSLPINIPAYYPRPIPMQVNLASLESVFDFVENLSSKIPKIDILVNNAGVAYPRGTHLETKDRIEIHFGINHLAHFYLTQLLLYKIDNFSGRVIVITSTLHERGKLDFKSIKEMEFGFFENLYANSKLANVYFVRQLAARTKNSNIKVLGVCPGWVYTRLFRNSMKWYHWLLVPPIALLFMKSPRQGAETAIYCATEPNLESGQLYANCKKYNSKTIFYDEIGEQLWQESEDMIKNALNKQPKKTEWGLL